MRTLPVAPLNYFDYQDIPTFILCNPDRTELFALGGISDRKFSPRFNALSEITFRADRVVDGIEMEYYPYLTNRRLIYIPDIGYFVINSDSETDDGIVRYKTIKAQSAEVELSSRKIQTYISGSSLVPQSITLDALLSDIMEEFAPDWTTGSVPINLSDKYRGFDVSDITLYNFLTSDVSEAYGCVFDFDTENKIIYIYDAGITGLGDTGIYISKDNLIRSINIEEITDELTTKLNVAGGGGLTINTVNPLGNNYIYNFDYFKNTGWMSSNLIERLDAWETDIAAASPSWSDMVILLYSYQDSISASLTAIAGSSACYAGFEEELAIAIEQGWSASDIVLSMQLLEGQILAASALVLDTYDLRDSLLNQMDATSDYLNPANYLGTDNPANGGINYFALLQPYILTSTYTNDNILQTESMSAASVVYYAGKLLEAAGSALYKMSQPRYSFSIDSVNFLSIKEFDSFRENLSLGKCFTLELEEGTSISPILLGVDIDFDNPANFKLLFSNRMRLDNSAEWLFTDILRDPIGQANKTKIASQQWSAWARTYQQPVSNFINSPINTTTNNIISECDGQIVINQGGITTRRVSASGTYEPAQMKIVNGLIAATTDGWITSHPLVGKIGDSWGVNAENLLGSISPCSTLTPSQITAGSLTSVNLYGNRGSIILSGSTGLLISTSSTYLKLDANGSLIYLSGSVQADANVIVAGGISASSTLIVAGNINAGSTLIVAGGISAGSTLYEPTVGKIISESGFATDGGIYIGAKTGDGGKGNVIATGSIKMSGGLYVGNSSGAVATNNIIAEGNITATGSMKMSGGLYVGSSGGTVTSDNIIADGDISATGNMNATGDITASGSVKMSGGLYVGNSGGAVTSNNIIADGNINATGNIGATGNITASGSIKMSGGLYVGNSSGLVTSDNLTVDGTTVSSGSIKTGAGLCVGSTSGAVNQGNIATIYSETITTACPLADGYCATISESPTYSASSAKTVTRHNYITLSNPVVTNVAVTHAPVFRFDAAAGTHKALDAGTSKTSASITQAWMKINVNGTIYYIPAYTSKT